MSGVHDYSYDDGGRLKTWDAPGQSVVTYVWDDSGNRTAAGTDTWTYDERNRLKTGPDGGYTYDARGTVSEIGTDTYAFDASGRLVDFNGEVEYSYDGLDRVATRLAGSSLDVFTYAGMGLDPVADGTFTYSRTPAGRVMAQTDGTDVRWAGLDKHGDLTGLLDPVTGLMTDTVVFDPFGDAVSSTGTTGQTLGFQGDYTDPASDEVWMGARWYNGGDAAFRSRDTVFGQLTTPISLNRYTYGWASPLNYWDPDGRAPGYVEGLDGPPLPGFIKAHAPTSNLGDLSPGSVVVDDTGSTYFRDDFIAMFSDEILASIVEKGRIWELVESIRAGEQNEGVLVFGAGDLARDIEAALKEAHLTESGLTSAEIEGRIGHLNSRAGFGAAVFNHRDLAVFDVVFTCDGYGSVLDFLCGATMQPLNDAQMAAEIVLTDPGAVVDAIKAEIQESGVVGGIWNLTAGEIIACGADLVSGDSTAAERGSATTCLAATIYGASGTYKGLSTLKNKLDSLPTSIDNGIPGGAGFDDAGTVDPRDVHSLLADAVDVDFVRANGDLYIQPDDGQLVRVLDNGDGTSDVVVYDPSNPSGTPTTQIADMPNSQVESRISDGRWE